MSVIVTPRQLSRRSELYHQLSQLLNAGIGLIEALKIQLRSPPSASFRPALARMKQSLESGSTFADAIAATGNWMPAFDAAMLHAGERSGRLPNCFTLLAQFYEERATLTRQMMSDLAYPVFLFHFAVLIGPIPQLFLTGNIGSYLVTILSILLPVYAVVLILLSAGQDRRSEAFRSFVEAVTRAIPLFGRARFNLALARLAAALEALVNAGVPIIESWELAAAASGSPALRRAVGSWRPRIEAGQTPAEAVAQSPQFPELFSTMYNTGEITGQLDETLSRLHALYRDEGSRQLRAVAQWTPKLIYMAIMLMIAYRIVSFYTGYFSGAAELIP